MEMSAQDYENSLAHYGILRRSGRYPWGSGGNPSQRSQSFLQIVDEHKKNGLSESDIAKLYDRKEDGFPFTVNDLRAAKTHSVTIQKQEKIRQAHRLKDKGMGYSEIARQMSGPEKTYNESSIRSLLEPGRLEKLSELEKVADMLKRQVDEKGMVDVGAHVQRDLPIGDNAATRIGISKDKFDTALSMIKEEGYAVGTYRSPQVGTGEMTNYRAAFKPSKRGMRQEQINHEAWTRRNDLKLISEKLNRDTGAMEEMMFKKPLSIDSNRIQVKYKEDGGADADGMIYVRPGVRDLSLGKSHYAQVRVAVDDTHFLKGMAVYKDDLPKGVDVVFNTNKTNTGNKHDAMKPLKTRKTDTGTEIDWDNPFGSFPKPGGQLLEGPKGNKKPYSAMNRLNEEGDWNEWSRKLSGQFLSKQKPEIAKAQLDLTYDRRRDEYEKIKNLTNPLIKRKLLESFADETDSSAVYLKAANMPMQATKVLLPVGKMKPNEVYAPGYKDGERVALVRFPHAGTFEIPELTVNNRNPAARELFGVSKNNRHPIDAIGIHPKVAELLSGADFDGDTVVVIPQRGQIKTRPPLEGLKNFDPQAEYKVPLAPKTKRFPDGTPTITKGRKETEMGKVTNLIADMTIKGAKDHEIANAVRHSMVVIDSEKHNLDFKASERDHQILALKKRYQAGISEKGNPTTGASTLLTRSTSRKDVPKRKDAKAGPGVTRTSTGTIDNRTGKKVYERTGEVGPNGKLRTFRSKKMAETDDPHSLLSAHGGTQIERIYADHSKKLKDLAQESRRELVRTEVTPRDKSATKVYDTEVKSLKGKLNEAQKNAPLERQAQALANQMVAQRRKANPEMDASEKKKIRGKALEEARARTGANKARVDITDREWEAIQNHAVSKETLRQILNNTDVDKLRERATPHDRPVMTDAITRRAKQMRNSGATDAEIADALGIPVSTIQSGLKG